MKGRGASGSGGYPGERPIRPVAGLADEVIRAAGCENLAEYLDPRRAETEGALDELMAELEASLEGRLPVVPPTLGTLSVGGESEEDADPRLQDAAEALGEVRRLVKARRRREINTKEFTRRLKRTLTSPAIGDLLLDVVEFVPGVGAAAKLARWAALARRLDEELLDGAAQRQVRRRVGRRGRGMGEDG